MKKILKDSEGRKKDIMHIEKYRNHGNKKTVKGSLRVLLRYLLILGEPGGATAGKPHDIWGLPTPAELLVVNLMIFEGPSTPVVLGF